MRKKYIVPVVAFLGILIISGCGKKKAPPPRMGGVPVTVAQVIQKDIPIEVENVGTIEAYSTVSVLSQVGGELTRVSVKEGQDVRKGDVLFKVDSRPYEADLQHSEATLDKDMAVYKQTLANLVRDSAQWENAKIDVKRYDKLIQGGVVTQQEYDNVQTNGKVLAANVEADQAAIKSAEESIRVDKTTIENAKIKLNYCTVRSPIDGRAGVLLINQGNVVKAIDKPIIMINKISPIYVTFTLPEKELPNIKKYNAQKRLKVLASIPHDEGKPVQGTLSFIDNMVDPNTGTIRLKGEFTNKDKRLWPGQYVNVTLVITTEPNAVIVPTEAVQNGQQGQYLYVVKSDKSVELRTVTVARTYEHDAVISKGVNVGETVVTDGQLRLVPGAKVQIKNTGEPSKPSSEEQNG